MAKNFAALQDRVTAFFPSAQDSILRKDDDGGSGRRRPTLQKFSKSDIQQGQSLLKFCNSTFLCGVHRLHIQPIKGRETTHRKSTESRLAQQPLERKQKLAFQPKRSMIPLDEIDSVAKEPHKYFDQAVITVKAGEGGNGALIKKTKKKPPGKGQKPVKSKRAKAKRGPDGEIQLPMGGAGGDIVLYAEENLETLLQFHRKKKFQGGRGGNVDTMLGLGGDLADGSNAPVLRVPVPVGTVIKRKRGGAFIADLNRPGAEICVAKGGQGGVSSLESTTREDGAGDVVTSSDEKALLTGTPGEEVKLELTLRVVADLGLVGLPNAGKSSLLKAVSKAKPEIADYPFTTLMPNLGRLAGDPLSEDGGADFGATMADLPGLIEGAHMGRGLGRMFLRHLRRTRLLVHVVDASNPDPLQDYRTLREELRMYNPDYLKRPYIIVLNKIDKPEAAPAWESLRDKLLTEQDVKTKEADESILARHADDVSQGEANVRDGSDTDAGIEGARIDGAESLELGESSEAAVNSLDAETESDSFAEWDEAVARAKAEARSPGKRKGGAQKGQSAGESEELNRNALPKAVLGISAREGLGIDAFLRAVRVALKEDESSPVLQSERKRERSQLIKNPSWTI